MQYRTDNGLWLRPNENGTLSVGLLPELGSRLMGVSVAGEHALKLFMRPEKGGAARGTVDIDIPVKGDMVVMNERWRPGESTAYYRPGYQIDLSKVFVMPDPSGEEEQE